MAVGSSESMRSNSVMPERLGLEAAGAVEGLLAFDVALDFRVG